MIKNNYLNLSFYFKIAFLLLGFSTCLSAQSIINHQWSNVKMGGGGFVSAIISCPTEANLFFARTDVGGAYRWVEETQSWKPITDWVSESQKALLGVESIAIDPNSPNKVYITAGLSGYGWSGASFLRSTDYGETFDVIPLDLYIHGNGMGRQTGEKLQVDPNNGSILYMGTRTDGLWKSEDEGMNWTTLASFPVTNTPNLNGISFLVLDKNSVANGKTQTMIAGVSKTGENLYISNDAGASWEPIPNAPTAAGIMPHRAVLSEDGNTLYLTYANGGGPHAQNWDGVNEMMNRGAVFKVNLATNTWTNISPIDLWETPEFNGCYGGITISQEDDQKIYVSTINHWNQQQFYLDGSSAWGDRIFESEDGGATWGQLFQTEPALRLDNNGINWISGHNLHWVGCLTLDPFDDSRIFATSGNGVFMSDNLDMSEPTMKFTVSGIEETVPLDMISIPDGPFLSIVGDYDGWLHDDINEFPFGPRHTPHMGTSSGIAFSYQNTDLIVRAGSSNGVLYYSEDQGLTWEPFESLPIPANSGKVAVSSAGNTNLVAWIPGDNDDKFYITSDFGSTWTNMWNPSFGALANAHPYPDPADPRAFYVYSAGNGALYKCLYPAQSMPQVEELATFHSGGSPHIAVNPYQSEEVWVAVNNGGIVHYLEGQLDTIDNIKAQAVAVGKPLNEDAPPTLFAWGTVKNTDGVYRSLDLGKTWFRMNNDAYEYGGLGNAGMIIGDQNTFGRVYMSTAGRGIAVGDSGLDTLYLDPDDISTSSFEPDFDFDVKVISNPFKDQLEVQAALLLDRINIYDTNGRVIFTTQEKKQHYHLNTASWNGGIYFGELISKDKQIKKLIKLVKLD